MSKDGAQHMSFATNEIGPNFEQDESYADIGQVQNLAFARSSV